MVAVEQAPCHHAYAAGWLCHHHLHQASAAAAPLPPLLQVVQPLLLLLLLCLPLLRRLLRDLKLPPLMLLLEGIMPLCLAMVLHQGLQDQYCHG
jgi:hypothetical protein